MRDKELEEMKKLNIKGQITDRHLKRIKQRMCKKSFCCCCCLVQFLRRIYAGMETSQNATVSHSGFALSFIKAVAMHLGHTAVSVS